MQSPRVRLLIEGSHANGLDDLLHHVLVLLDGWALLVASVSDPDLSLLHLEVVLGFQDVAELFVRLGNAVDFDRVEALGDANDKRVIIAVGYIEEVLSNAD